MGTVGHGLARSGAHGQSVSVPRLPDEWRERCTFPPANGQKPAPLALKNEYAVVVPFSGGVYQGFTGTEPAKDPLLNEMRICDLHRAADLLPGGALSALGGGSDQKHVESGRVFGPIGYGMRTPAHGGTESCEESEEKSGRVRLSVRLDGPYHTSRQPVESSGGHPGRLLLQWHQEGPPDLGLSPFHNLVSVESH
jgi:hypothetical protein